MCLIPSRKREIEINLLPSKLHLKGKVIVIEDYIPVIGHAMLLQIHLQATGDGANSNILQIALVLNPTMSLAPGYDVTRPEVSSSQFNIRQLIRLAILHILEVINF